MLSLAGRGNYTGLRCVWQVKSEKNCDFSLIFWQNGGLDAAGIAIDGGGEGGIHEDFSHFFGNEADIGALGDDADEEADDEESSFPHGDAGAEEGVVEAAQVAFAAEGGEAKEPHKGIDGDADEGAVGDFLPFKVVLRRAAMEDFSAAAPEEHTAAVYLAQQEEEANGGKKQVE